MKALPGKSVCVPRWLRRSTGGKSRDGSVPIIEQMKANPELQWVYGPAPAQ